MFDTPFLNFLFCECKLKRAAYCPAPFQVCFAVQTCVRQTFVFLPIDRTNPHTQHFLNE